MKHCLDMKRLLDLALLFLLVLGYLHFASPCQSATRETVDAYACNGGQSMDFARLLEKEAFESSFRSRRQNGSYVQDVPGIPGSCKRCAFRAACLLLRCLAGEHCACKVFFRHMQVRAGPTLLNMKYFDELSTFSKRNEKWTLSKYCSGLFGLYSEVQLPFPFWLSHIFVSRTFGKSFSGTFFQIRTRN